MGFGVPDLEIHYSGDWAALYADGKLVDGTVGDSYHAEEKAFEMAGVKTVHNDDFMRGQSQRDGVAKNLQQIKEYRRDREVKEALAADLREQAAALLRSADELESST